MTTMMNEEPSIHSLALTYTLWPLLASVSCLSFVLVLCLCCYKPARDEGEDWDEVDGGTGAETSLLPSLTEKLFSHSKSTSSVGSEVISLPRVPEQTTAIRNVQPDPLKQWSLSRSLGLTGLPPDLQSSTASSPTSQHSAAAGPRLLSPGVSLGGRESPLGSCMTSADESQSRAPLGRIQFFLRYNHDQTTLHLKLICATELPAKDFSGTSDPYVKILLLPDRKHKLLSNIKRKNLNPQWNESFAFEGYPYAKIRSKTLYLQVLDYDRFSRDDPIGELCLHLEEVDLTNGETLWRDLQPCKGHAGKLGELLVSLCYQQSTGTITIGLVRARDLKAKDINGFSDPYVKIWLTIDGKKIEKKKTKTHQKTLNPVF